MVVSSVVGMSAPASAVSGINNPATYLNENFNNGGFSALTAGVHESVLILGSDTAASFDDRRVVFFL